MSSGSAYKGEEIEKKSTSQKTPSLEGPRFL